MADWNLEKYDKKQKKRININWLWWKFQDTFISVRVASLWIFENIAIHNVFKMADRNGRLIESVCFQVCNRFHYFDTFPTGRERRRTWFFRHAKFTTYIFGHRGRGRTKNNLVFPKSPVSRHPCRFSHKVGNPSIFRPFSIDRETRLNRHFTNSKSSSEIFGHSGKQPIQFFPVLAESLVSGYSCSF